VRAIAHCPCRRNEGTFSGDPAMTPTVRLTVLTGPHKGRKFCFRGATQCMLGRAEDCFVQFYGTARDQLISRHHCELDIDESSIRIRDLGSCNGTYVNTQRLDPAAETVVDCAACPGAVLGDADVISLGGITLQVHIVDCPPAGNEADKVWQPGENAKRDCPLTC